MKHWGAGCQGVLGSVTGTLHREKGQLPSARTRVAEPNSLNERELRVHVDSIDAVEEWKKMVSQLQHW